MRKRERNVTQDDSDSLWYLDNAWALVALVPGGAFCFHGRVLLRVLGGSVCVAGALLDDPMLPVELYAPLTRAALALECASDIPAQPAEQLGLPEGLDSRVGTLVGCLVMLQPLAGSPVAPLTRTLFSGPWLRVACSNEARETFPAAWAEVVSEIEQTFAHPVVLVCGKRGVGKSSLARFVANKLAARGGAVTFVDLDPGQPELGPPGSVSVATVVGPLLSPGFCSPPRAQCLEDVVSLVVPGTSADAAPHHFEACVQRLFALVRSRTVCPVVINTAGWITGLGLELLRTCVATFTPTAVLQVLDADAPAEALAFGAIPVYPLFSQVSLHGPKPPKHATAAQTRDVCLSTHLGLEHADALHADPLAVRDVLVARVCISVFEADELAPDMVFMALHETVVALVHSPSWIERRGTFCTDLPDDGVLVAFGIVRGFSSDASCVLIQCAPYVDLNGVNVLVRAAHSLPYALCSADGAYTSASHVGGLGDSVMTGSKWITRAHNNRE